MTADRIFNSRAGIARVGLAGSVLAASLLAGCTGSHVHSASRALPQQTAEKGQVKADRAIARAEQAALRTPQDAAARTALGRAYLAAGRFDSAATALDDAMTLGDNSGQTALSLALAQIGQGRFQDAVALLDDWRAEIPASDRGLALALSGETSRGVAVLADALRSGQNTPKLRQNLAYAYALDGRWQDARVMAAQDVPADQLERRMALWALSTLPDRNGERVAALLDAPVRRDPGQPAALALRTDPAKEQLAAETAATAPAHPAAPAAELAAAPPAAGLAAVPPAAAVPAPTMVSVNLAAQTAPQIAPQEPAARAQPATLTQQVVKVAAAARQSVSQAFGSQGFAAAPAPAAAPVHAVAVRPAARFAPAVAAAGTHYVQLGSFSSPQGARRAWGIYTRQNHSLSAYRMTITPATVHGKAVWRVAAGGLGNRLAANGLCSSVRARGGACFAYAAPTKAAPAPGVPQRAPGGPQMARR